MSFAKWTKFSKLPDNCPICNGQHKRCRTDGSLVICGEDAQVPGWKNIGQDKAGIGHLYKPDSSQLSEYKKLPKPEPVKPSRVSHLTLGEINNLLLDMLCQQPVEDWAKADLLKRGVEPTGLLGKSFPRGVIDDKYDGLPGTYRDSQDRLRTVAPNDSYFCPIFNEDGLVVGGQLKIKGGKYIWLSAGNKGGYTQHINGKTPHTLCNSNQDKRSQFFINEGKGNKQRKNVILFSEGVLKPFIINQLSGYPCIGAVGGNFKGDFDGIDKFITKITNNNPDQFTFAIAADAGSGINDLVLSQYKALVKHIKERYDKRVHIVWYGQYAKKEHLDFDHILATEKTKHPLIPFYRFIKKNEEFKVLKQKKKFTAKHRFSSIYIPVSNHFWGEQHNAIVEFTKNINKGRRNILALKSPMGTGKTEALKKILELLGCGIFLIGYRNSLLLQTGERIPAIYHQTELADRSQFAAKTESISLCIDSCWKISVEDVQSKVIVLDEAPLVLEHLLTSDTCKSRRFELMTHFEALLASCAGVVIMSDQLTDKEVDLVQKASNVEDKSILAVENTYQMPSRKVTVYDYENHLRQVLNDVITEGKKIFLASDSQKFTETWGRKTIEEIKSDCRTLVINSETLYQKEVQDFLKSPNEYLHLYDFVLTSPTAESGLSINEKYFDAIFVRWTHLGLDACAQIMHRVRDTDCPIHLFAYGCKDGQKSVIDLHNERIDRKYLILAEKEKLDSRYICRGENASDKEISDFIRFHFESSDSMNNNIRDYEESPLTAYLDELKETRLTEQHSFRDLLVHDLKVRGYDVEKAPEVETDKEAIGTSKQSEAIKEEKSLAILEAKDLTDNEYEKANRREVKTPQELAEVRRYNLLQSLPGIDRLEGWGGDLIKNLKFDKPDNMRKLWKRYLLENEDLNVLIRDKRVISSLIHGFSPNDWDITQSVITELKKISYILTPLIKRKSFHSESPLVRVFICAIEKCKYLPKQGKMGNMQCLNKVLDLIGYKASCKGQRRDRDGNRRREYVIEDNLYYEVGESKERRKVMLQPLLQECLDKKKMELFEKYDVKYFEEQKKKFLGEEILEEKPVLFTRELLTDEEYMEDMQYVETIEVADKDSHTIPEKFDLPTTSKETASNNATPEIDTSEVKQIVSYFFSGIKSGIATLDQIASSIERFGREVFEQACYQSSLLLGKCIDVDYGFIVEG